jgi:hypothetical protein
MHIPATTPMRRLLIGGLAGLVLFTTACGSDDDASPSATDIVSSESTAPAPVEETVPAATEAPLGDVPERDGVRYRCW